MLLLGGSFPGALSTGPAGPFESDHFPVSGGADTTTTGSPRAVLERDPHAAVAVVVLDLPEEAPGPINVRSSLVALLGQRGVRSGDARCNSCDRLLTEAT